MKDSFLPKKYREYLGLGAEIATALAAPILIGYYIDVKFQTTPVGVLLGAAIGLFLFFLVVFRIVKRFGS
ncbi:MAG: AtpZ/AtpI family protein [Balneolales bacterium]|nr:AtpZ/AtpI family protein [Balneolales bacterium]